MKLSFSSTSATFFKSVSDTVVGGEEIEVISQHTDVVVGSIPHNADTNPIASVFNVLQC